MTLRDLIDWTSRDAVRFFLITRKADTEFVFDVDLALQERREPGVLRAVRACAHLLGFCPGARKGFDFDVARAQDVPLEPWPAESEHVLLARLGNIRKCCASLPTTWRRIRSPFT